MATQWFYKDAGEERGPVPFRELVQLVRSKTVTENDLVRSAWNPEWQRADSVVGLFYMAGRAAEEPAQLNTAARPPAEPVAAEAISNVEEPCERPGWLQRLFSVGGLRKKTPAEVPIDALPAIDAGAAPSASQATSDSTAGSPGQQSLAPELADYATSAANSTNDGWSSLVGEGVERAAGIRPALGRWGRLIRHVSRALAAVLGAGQSSWFRPAFRLVCAVVCSNLVAIAVESWSAEEALRFPSRETTLGRDAGAQQFPFIGKCSGGEYLILTFHLMLFTGAGAYFAARWLDSHAE